MSNGFPRVSIFMRLTCHNPKCPMYMAGMVVEKETMVVLWTDYIMVDGKPAWPSHWRDVNGNQVLPKPSV